MNEIVAKKSARTNVLDWWQKVLDETKDLVDDGIGRLRDDDDDDDEKISSDIAELKRAVAELSTKLDRLAGTSTTPGG